MFKQIRVLLTLLLCLSLVVGTAFAIISCVDDDDVTTTTTTTAEKIDKDDPAGGTTTTKPNPDKDTTTSTSTTDNPDPEPETCSFYALARRISGKGMHNGGDVRDLEDNSISYIDYNDPVGTERTLVSFCYPDHYFLGWYSDDAELVAQEGAKLFTDSDDGTVYALVSEEKTYTLTIEKDIRICALYAHKKDAISMEYGIRGVSTRNEKPVKTIVAMDSDDKPNFIYTDCYVQYPDGSEDSAYCTIDDGGLDYNKPGTYTITVTATNFPYLSDSFEIEVVEQGHRLQVNHGLNVTTKFIYNYVNDKLSYIDTVVPAGKLVTIMAVPQDEYGFLGWYDKNGKLVSEELVYTFIMPNGPVELYAEVDRSTALTKVNVWGGEGGRVGDGFGNEPPFYSYGYKEDFWRCIGTKFTLTALPDDGYRFVGWYRDVYGLYDNVQYKNAEKVCNDPEFEIETTDDDKTMYIIYYPVFEKIETEE